jgi:3-oxoacyl-[acyl-carrier-protein] synthase I
MATNTLALQSIGLICSVGSDASAVCAALRCGISNPSVTKFMGSDRQWLLAHQVHSQGAFTGNQRLVKMAGIAAAECMDRRPPSGRSEVPVVLCLADGQHLSRMHDLQAALLEEIERACRCRVDREKSSVVARGRPSVLIALDEAKRLILELGVELVLILAVDTLLTGSTLAWYVAQNRVLDSINSNGFIPGEAAGAVLVGRSRGEGGELVCLGNGSSLEAVTVDSEAPLRAAGLSSAITAALGQAGLKLEDIDYRIGDASGEHYYFKEAALAVGRIFRTRKQEFDLWLPAESVGEVGAAIGAIMLGVALTAAKKGYAKGPRVLVHASSDQGLRAASVLTWAGAPS